MMELLEKEMDKEDMPLHEDEKNLLRKSLETGKFKSGVDMCKRALRMRDEEKAAEKLEDIEPLFYPHQFWDDQPVPKLGDVDTLPDEDFNKPIEVKTLDQV